MEAHRDFVLSLVQPLTPFGMALVDAVGLQVNEDIHADVAVPAFNAAAVDGYAVRATDVRGAGPSSPVRLPVDGEVWAGDGPLPSMTARMIRVGQQLPAGADTVVAKALTDKGRDTVTIHGATLRGQNVRDEGSDIAEGSLLVERGTVLDSRLVAVLAASGMDKVLVRPRPRLVVMSVGDELVSPERSLGAGETYDTASYVIAASAKELGADVWRIGVLPDDPDEVRQVLADQQIRADLIVVTGGLADGPYGVVGTAVRDLGSYDIAEVALDPGGWQGIGILGDDEVPVMMLPGDPVSAYVAFQAFVRPVVLHLMGGEPVLPETVTATAAMGMTSSEGILDVCRGLVTESRTGLVVSLVGGHTTHLISQLPQANALVLLGPETEFVAAGDEVEVWLLDA